MSKKLQLVPEVQIECGSSPDYSEQIRIAFTRYKGTRYIDVRAWRPMKDGKFTDPLTGEWAPTRQGVTLTPLSILGSIIKALREIHRVHERWIEKGWRTRTKDPHLIRVALERLRDLEFVDVRTWVVERGRYTATERGLVIPLEVLDQVIKGLEQFARPMWEVNPRYLTPRFVLGPERPRSIHDPTVTMTDEEISEGGMSG
ncbi:MAG: transcriptional coactivator p15/PC4 family protein [Candidatus Bathyarchaeia archaeon]